MPGDASDRKSRQSGGQRQGYLSRENEDAIISGASSGDLNPLQAAFQDLLDKQS